MTAFEQATLAAQDAAFWVAVVGAAAAFVSAVASAAAAWGIWYGIRAMVRANKDRAVILDRQHEADERRHKEAMAAHAETMAAHAEAMVEGARRHKEAMAEGARRHAEAMAEGARRHEEAMDALAMQGRSLEALIGGLERQTASLERVVERTAPPPAE